MLRPVVLLGMVVGLPGVSRAQAPSPVAGAGPPSSKLIQSVVVRVLPDAGNRRLQLSVDAPTFYASTERQLDGVDGARAHTFNLHELPAGDYQIVAVLEGSTGVRTRLTRNFKVMGEDDTQLMETPRPTTRRRRGGS